MTKLLYVLIAIPVLIIVVFFALGVMSKKGETPGLKEGQLQACMSTDNCVISEIINGDPNTVEPFVFSGDKVLFVEKLKTALQSLGGQVNTIDGDYIGVTFTSAVFGFVDDVELRIAEDNILHFRSASRVGRKDFGANKKRVEALTLLLKD